MTRKFISWLSFMIVFSFALQSCVDDQIYSSSDSSSKEYHSKSLWKEDEVYIKNIMKVYEEHEPEIRKEHGIPLWEYAMTMDKFDESYLLVPVKENGKIVEVLEVPRFGKKVYFKYTDREDRLSFFSKLFIDNPKKALPTSLGNEASKIICVTRTISIWYPDNENNPNGSGHWGSSYYTQCYDITIDTFENPDDGSGGGGYDYPPFGGAGGDTPIDSTAVSHPPCAKTKSIVNNPKMQAGFTQLKNQSALPKNDPNYGELGIKFKADGTPSPTITGGKHEVNFGDKTGYQGAYHNHTIAGTPMFSPPDIDQLLGFARAQPTSDPTNINNAYLGMIAPNGIHYVITFEGTYQDAVTNFSQQQLTNFAIKYKEQASDLKETLLYGTTYINTDGSLNNLGVEKLFFNTLAQMGLHDKVNLQRVENGSIKSINLDANNNPTPIPCL